MNRIFTIGEIKGLQWKNFFVDEEEKEEEEVDPKGGGGKGGKSDASPLE